MNNIKTGVEGEVKASIYLKNNGYKIIDRNVKIGNGEIDIIAILPKRIQKKKLKSLFRNKIKTNGLIDKANLKFDRKVLNNNIKTISDIIVFIEVKNRSSKKFGNPYDAVDDNKQHVLERACISYLKKHNKTNVSARFDVISIIDEKIEHIENAFELKFY